VRAFAALGDPGKRLAVLDGAASLGNLSLAVHAAATTSATEAHTPAEAAENLKPVLERES
jgi:hypothetical protein